MKYLEINFHLAPCEEAFCDVLAAQAGEIGFESFTEQTDGITGYVQKNLFDETALKETIEKFPIPHVAITYSIAEAEDKDWNEEWEKNFFKPIIIGNECVIHSTFHKDVPKAKYDIIINPQMAFGTGHHETTSLVLEELLNMDLTGKNVLDMGCGTSILAILASMRGASKLTAIDIDTWCVENSKENIALNHIRNIDVELGDASLLKGKAPFDTVIANINRNILLNDMHSYAACMNQGATLLMSGFYKQDIPIIKAEAENLGLAFAEFKEKNNWVVTKFEKM